MVKRYIIKLLFEHGPKLFRSFLYAYKDATKDMPKGNKNDDSFTSKLGFTNILNTPLTKEEAMKILNIKPDQVKPETIMEQFEKYMEANDPEKGGSFYIQNKVYYAKEMLMGDFDPELNFSKYNPGQEDVAQETAQEVGDKEADTNNKEEEEKKENEDVTEKDKKI
jgi:import inner membrane translocase subunit TIM16